MLAIEGMYAYSSVRTSQTTGSHMGEVGLVKVLDIDSGDMPCVSSDEKTRLVPHNG